MAAKKVSMSPMVFGGRRNWGSSNIENHGPGGQEPDEGKELLFNRKKTLVTNIEDAYGKKEIPRTKHVKTWA